MWNDLTRSLQHRNYRHYLLGQLVSLNGTQMASVAQAWLVYHMTQSSMMLGMVHFSMLVPVLLFALFSGVLADRFPRRRLLLFSQGSAMLLSFLLALLALGGWIELWHIFVIAFLIGTTQAIDMPVRQAFLAELVPKQMLSNAVGLNSGVFNTARFLGPAIAGLLLLQWEPGYLFALNGMSYLLLLYILWMMRIEASTHTPRAREGKRTALTNGLRYVWGHQEIRPALFHVGVVSMMGTAFVVLMPVFADQHYQGGSDTLGWLLAAAGAGSLIGALNLARKRSGVPLAPVICSSGVVGAIALALFAFSEWLPLSLLILFVAGFSITTVVASTNAYIQQLVEDQMRGRLMAVFSMIFVGMAPFGSLTAGVLAEWQGIQFAVLLFSLLGVTASLYFMVGLFRNRKNGVESEA